LIEKVARYVSLIPFVEDNRQFEDMPDMWCSSQEFLDLGAGDYEEHAVLLCNYFKYIDEKKGKPNIESFIVLGKGIPEGYTTYVLRRDKNTKHCELWNAIKGEAYYFGREVKPSKVMCFNYDTGVNLNIRQFDAKCQLKSVGCVISEDNVYANI
jgi:coiled-coil and C2 domain-containing protein 2A